MLNYQGAIQQPSRIDDFSVICGLSNWVKPHSDGPKENALKLMGFPHDLDSNHRGKLILIIIYICIYVYI